MEAERRRFVGIDLGKREYTTAVIGTNGKMKIHQGKTSIQGRQALYRLLERTDKVAPGAGNLAFIMAREIMERAGSEARVLNPAKLPVVPLPSEQEMERRKLPANYSREVKGRTRNINLLQVMFAHQGHTTIVRKNLATAERRREAVKLLTGQEREEAEWILKHLDLHDERIKELKSRINKEAKKDEDMKNLQTIAGVGPVVAYAYAAHVGDGSRFSSGSQVSNYLGFVPRLDYSGETQRQGHITKRGNGYLRGLLARAAWVAVRFRKGGVLRERYFYKTAVKGLSKKKTVVAAGRRLAELMYSVLRNKSAYEPRPWTGVRDDVAELTKLTEGA